jgi:hypothetical protein
MTELTSIGHFSSETDGTGCALRRSIWSFVRCNENLLRGSGGAAQQCKRKRC